MHLNDVISNPPPVISGVPQESVLGPILFLVFNNTYDSVLSSKVLIFADDTKLYMIPGTLTLCRWILVSFLHGAIEMYFSMNRSVSRSDFS